MFVSICTEARFSKVPVTFRDRKAVLCSPCLHSRSINNVENDTMELSVHEAELAGLVSWNFATIQQVLICLRVQVTEPFEKRALADFFKESYRVLSLATTRLRKNDWVKIPFQNCPIEKFDTIDLVSRATIRG